MWRTTVKGLDVRESKAENFGCLCFMTLISVQTTEEVLGIIILVFRLTSTPRGP